MRLRQILHLFRDGQEPDEAVTRRQLDAGLASAGGSDSTTRETVPLGTTYRVLEGRQHIVYGQMRIDGDLELRGSLIVL